MNPDDVRSRAISEWLDEFSARRVPEHLDAVLRQTRARRQRPAWSIPERWLPMDLTSRASTLAPPRLGRVLLIVLLLLASVGIAIVAIGSRPHRVPPPFGPARNGELLASADGDIFVVDPKSGQTSPVIAGPTSDFGPMFSRDGTKFLFLRGGSDNGLDIVVANADGTGAFVITHVTNGPDWVDWSPDGTRIAFLSRTRDRGTINIVNVDGSESARAGGRPTGQRVLLAAARRQGDRVPGRAPDLQRPAARHPGRAPGRVGTPCDLHPSCGGRKRLPGHCRVAGRHPGVLPLSRRPVQRTRAGPADGDRTRPSRSRRTRRSSAGRSPRTVARFW